METFQKTLDAVLEYNYRNAYRPGGIVSVA